MVRLGGRVTQAVVHGTVAPLTPLTNRDANSSPFECVAWIDWMVIALSGMDGACVSVCFLVSDFVD